VRPRRVMSRRPGSRLAASVLAMTNELATNDTAPSSTSTTPLRSVLNTTGEWRMSSSTAYGASSGTLRQQAPTGPGGRPAPARPGQSGLGWCRCRRGAVSRRG
jgi:hypothetical protein